MNNINAEMYNWFPTLFIDASAPQFVGVAESIYKAVNWDNARHPEYKNGETTYFNRQDLPTVPGIDEFKRFICASTEAMAEVQGVNLEKWKCEVQSMWMSNMRNGAKHDRHAHAGSIYSGTYYVNAPDGCSKIRFHNPLMSLWGLAMPPSEQEDNPFTSAYVDFDPRPGRMLLWNSWLYHEVLENKSQLPRKTISFNLNMTKRET